MPLSKGSTVLSGVNLQTGDVTMSALHDNRLPKRVKQLLFHSSVAHSKFVVFFSFFINRRDILSHFSGIIVACEYSRFSLLRTFRQEERLRLSDSNSILMT